MKRQFCKDANRLATNIERKVLAISRIHGEVDIDKTESSTFIQMNIVRTTTYLTSYYVKDVINVLDGYVNKYNNIFFGFGACERHDGTFAKTYPRIEVYIRKQDFKEVTL